MNPNLAGSSVVRKRLARALCKALIHPSIASVSAGRFDPADFNAQRRPSPSLSIRKSPPFPMKSTDCTTSGEGKVTTRLSRIRSESFANESTEARGNRNTEA